MIEDDIRAEREAIKQYQEHMRLIDDPSVQMCIRDSGWAIRPPSAW